MIPVKNESLRLGDCLRGIARQTVEVEEILVIDSGSEDGSQAIAAGFPKVKLIEIPSDAFNNGETRNLGVAHATGDYVLLTVGDAWAVDEFWIARLLEGFLDETVAGVCGSQVVSHAKDTNPVEWFRPQSEPKIRRYRFRHAAEFDAATPEEKLAAGSWDNVTALYRRRVLQSIPFRRGVYGEDVFWAIDVLRAGYELAYRPGARVYHFHRESFETTLKRVISVSYLRYRSFGVTPGKMHVIRSLTRRAYRLMKEEGLSSGERLRWFGYNLTSVRAMAKGLRLFHEAIERGGDGLEHLHEQYCGSPPLPLKTTGSR